MFGPLGEWEVREMIYVMKQEARQRYESTSSAHKTKTFANITGFRHGTLVLRNSKCNWHEIEKESPSSSPQKHSWEALLRRRRLIEGLEDCWRDKKPDPCGRNPWERFSQTQHIAVKSATTTPSLTFQEENAKMTTVEQSVDDSRLGFYFFRTILATIGCRS